MKDVIEAARQFGEAIKETPELSAYFQAKEMYETDEELQGYMFEYETQRKVLSKEFEKDINDQNPELIRAINERIRVLATEIVGIPIYRVYEDAKQTVNSLMQKINAQISTTVFGEQPTSCTHDCSTCSGCAGHTQNTEEDS